MVNYDMYTITPGQATWTTTNKIYGVVDIHEFAWDELRARLEEVGLCFHHQQIPPADAEYAPAFLLGEINGKPGLILGDLIYRRGRERLPSDPPSPFASPEPGRLEREREV